MPQRRDLLITIAACLLTAGGLSAQCLIDTIDNPFPDSDRFGPLAVRGDFLAIGDNVAFDNAGAVFVYRRDASGWVLDDTILSPRSQPKDDFGFPIVFAGDDLVVGAHRTDAPEFNSGAAFVYRRVGPGDWQFVQSLTARGVDAFDKFGYSVAATDDCIVVGAIDDDDPAGERVGAAYVFRRDRGAWVEEARLIDKDAEEFDLFGFAVAISGDWVIVGARGNDDFGGSSGAAFAFERRPRSLPLRASAPTGDPWVFRARLIPENPTGGMRFGSTVALLDDLAVVGAPNAFSNDGAAYVFRLDAGTWEFEATLQGEPVGVGPLFSQPAIAPSLNTVVVAAPGDAAEGSNAGAVYVFDYDRGDWNQRVKLVAEDAQPGDAFGWPAIQGDTLFLSAAQRMPGRAYEYRGVETLDCNGNAVPDGCDLASGESADRNDDGIPDECAADLDGDGSVGFGDLLLLLAAWGSCDTACAADLDDDGVVGFSDLLLLLAAWTTPDP